MKSESVFLSNLHHAYAQTDGSYAFPNSREGDMLKRAKVEVEHLFAGVAKLRSAVADAEKEHRYACLNLGNGAQVAMSARLDHLRYAFALATGTAVGGAEFDALLKA